MATFNGIERLTGFPYPLWSPRSLARLAACVRAADAVHVHDCIYAGSLFAAWLARRHCKRLAVTQHIGLVPLPLPLRPVLACANRIGAWAVLRRANGVGYVSPAVRRYFETLTGPSSRYFHVSNGVDDTIFHAAPGESRARRAALGFDRSRPLLLFVGRFVPKKRLPLVCAMAEMRPDWQWCVIGQGPERPQDWRLPNVRVLPPVEPSVLADYYRAADLLVLPSHGEGFPLVVQEGMACGLPPCITNEVAAGGDMPNDLWLALPDSPADTALQRVAAIDAWLARPTDDRMAQRLACARHAAAKWQWDVAVRAHLGWLQENGT